MKYYFLMVLLLMAAPGIAQTRFHDLAQDPEKLAAAGIRMRSLTNHMLHNGWTEDMSPMLFFR